TTTTVTTTEATTTTTVTAPAGAIIWQIPTVEAKPGDTVTMAVTVNDVQNVGLSIGGAQFVITNDEGVNYVSAAAGDGYATKKYNINDTTRQNAFSTPIGGAAAPDGATVITLTFTVH
ncbi:MAG: hypothetical protein IJ874_03805, partial [Ruminococcus sp.]|nr:hypothetical protein [Ruminococcus sp.]